MAKTTYLCIVIKDCTFDKTFKQREVYSTIPVTFYTTLKMPFHVEQSRTKTILVHCQIYFAIITCW